MAIRGVNQRKVEAAATAPNSGVFGQAHAQPPAFRATGRGFFNRLPDFAATALNSNGSLTNTATAKTNGDLYKLYLFINDIQTGWSLAGEYGQGQLGRVFYPRNLSQDELVIEGTVANQYEYDRIVQFVEHHQNTQFTSRLAVAQSLDGNEVYPGVNFVLSRPVAGATLDSFHPLKYAMVITDVKAGAQRFEYARNYSLQCKVIYDYLEPRFDVQDDIRKRVTRQQVFGAAVNPSPRTGTNPPSNKKTTKP